MKVTKKEYIKLLEELLKLTVERSGRIYLCPIFYDLVYDNSTEVTTIEILLKDFPEFMEWINQIGVKYNFEYQLGDAWCSSNIEPQFNAIEITDLEEKYLPISGKIKIMELTNYIKLVKRLEKIEDQLISFETAKLAKEKGFLGMDSNDLGSLNLLYMSFLQKWLREEHGINTLALTDGELNWRYIIQSLHPKASYTGHSINNKDTFRTYEEALETGLIETLNLLK